MIVDHRNFVLRWCALLTVRIRLFLCLELGARGLLTETGVILYNIYLAHMGYFGSRVVEG